MPAHTDAAEERNKTHKHDLSLGGKEKAKECAEKADLPRDREFACPDPPTGFSEPGSQLWLDSIWDLELGSPARKGVGESLQFV